MKTPQMLSKKVFSAKLQDHFWVAPNREEMIRLRKERNREPIYLQEEIVLLRRLSETESLQAVHAIKTHFVNPIVLSVESSEE